MALDDPSANVSALKQSADAALRSGDVRRAADIFARAVTLAPRRLDLWMGLAASRRAAGDENAALVAVAEALAIEPRFFPAMLLRGALQESLGMGTAAALTYTDALKLAPPMEGLAEPTRRAIAHAQEVRDRHQNSLAARLREAIGLARPSTPMERRIEAFIETSVGSRRFFSQQPVQFYYPGMPVIEFYERDEFPWLEALEAHTQAIREEALAVWAEGAEGITPYVHYPPGVPLDQWADLNHSLNWGAFHLFEDGHPVEANTRRCPATMAALKVVDQPHVKDRSPAALFSILRPHTRIPPHTGISNTRLVLHLPLIVPEKCGFRVGGSTRPWREGEAFVFDDTIEHEAWNESDKPRAVFICDVWSPRLSLEERELVVRLTAALDDFNGIVAPGDGL